MKALLLIDTQKGFHDASWGKRNNPSMEGMLAKALLLARQAGMPVIHVRHDSREKGSPLTPGQAGHDFLPEVKPQAGEAIFSKRVHGAFVGTNLDEYLRNEGITELAIAGFVTDYCVSTTTRMAADLGYKATVLADATAAFDRTDQYGERIPAELVHRVALASLKDEFAAIANTENYFQGVRDANAHTGQVSHCTIAAAHAVPNG